MAEQSVESDAVPVRAILLTERARFGGETGAGLMRNRCAFTSRDMGADWPDAFVYAVVQGWDDDPDDHPDDQVDAMGEMAARWEWDDEMVTFLRDAHERFKQLADRVTSSGSGDADV